MSDEPDWAKAIKADTKATRDGVLQMREELKLSVRPAVEQTWRNKARLDQMIGALKSIGVAVALLTLFTLFLGIVQAVRAFGGI